MAADVDGDPRAAGAVVKPRCVCGCGRRAVQKHHVVYQQELRRRRDASDIVGQLALKGDKRNLVPIGSPCHAAHHNRQAPLPLRVLPDSVFEFAVEVLGAGAAYEYLARRYDGRDPRLDELLVLSDMPG